MRFVNSPFAPSRSARASNFVEGGTAKACNSNGIVVSYIKILIRIGASLFHLLSKLYERSSLMIITNFSFSEWSRVLVVAKMTAAALHRLPHHGGIVEHGNQSWRFMQNQGKAANEKDEAMAV